MSCLKLLAESLQKEGRLEHMAVRVGKGDRILAEYYMNTDPQTLFDMASVTKILSVTPLMLMALEQGRIALETPLSDALTVRHLLTHTMGVGHRNLCQSGVTYQNVGDYILSLEPEIPVGSDVRYSCPAFILLGKLLEKTYGKRLDDLFREQVAVPLGMSRSGFLPTERENIVNANATPEELGLVNDYNCRFLGGVAGNAGIFSCIEDLQKYAEMLLSRGAPLFGGEIFDLAAQNHTSTMSEARGLGFLYVDERYPQTGRLFPVGSIGHCGHTGQMLFVHPESGLYAIVLTDATLHHPKRYDLVKKMREEISNAIFYDISKEASH
ncbi:MAG: beta-lactamase family protein [Clostridia bacterium]|nr:beta-lactamase family protein [Clostridia bacterium]